VIKVNNVATTETIDIGGLPASVYQVIIFDKQGEKVDVQQLVKK
jgi:hypothetical protein